MARVLCLICGAVCALDLDDQGKEGSVIAAENEGSATVMRGELVIELTQAFANLANGGSIESADLLAWIDGIVNVMGGMCSGSESAVQVR